MAAAAAGRYEISVWDGERWTLDSAQPTKNDALSYARRILPRKKGVRVSEERFDGGANAFVSRIVFVEYRDRPAAGPAPKTPAPPTAASKSPRGKTGGDFAMPAAAPPPAAVSWLNRAAAGVSVLLLAVILLFFAVR
jgi:hypothetical protein